MSALICIGTPEERFIKSATTKVGANVNPSGIAASIMVPRCHFLGE